jgi:hypothetical protein
MALVFEAPDIEGAAPALHALIIGVGGYTHLEEGGGKKMADLLKFGSPGQLTSPPRSALAWVDALVDAREDWLVPLGSVDLLISPAPGADLEGDYESATREAIDSAFDDWWGRCNQNGDNVALFVFCGHGVQAESQILLAADFGKAKLRPWANAIDFDQTRLAFMANKARTQLFIVDACRQMTLASKNSLSNAASPLRAPDRNDRLHCEFDFTAKATNRQGSAYGEPNEPSYFTKALLAGLAGGAATQYEREWYIRTGELGSRIHDLMSLVQAPDDQDPQIVTVKPTFIRRVPVPTAHLRVRCQPAEATSQAELSWHRAGQPSRTRPARSPEAWTVRDIPVGSSTVHATFPDLDYSEAKEDFLVHPAISVDYIEVSRREYARELERP